MKKVAAPGLENKRLTAVGTRCADHVTPLYPQKLALTSPTGGGRSVGIVRVRTKATEICLYMFRAHHHQVKLYYTASGIVILCKVAVRFSSGTEPRYVELLSEVHFLCVSLWLSGHRINCQVYIASFFNGESHLLGREKLKCFLFVRSFCSILGMAESPES